MFIICPKCAAKYQIPDGITLQEGQKLKCSACDFIFLKGEESPLILEQPVIREPAETATEAFSTPLYTQPDSDNQTTNPANMPLPEAFQPVSNPAKSRTYLWFIPIYIILIVALCMMGWHFRDSLKPSFKEIIPKTKIEKQVREQKTESNKQIKENPVIPKETTVSKQVSPQPPQQVKETKIHQPQTVLEVPPAIPLQDKIEKKQPTETIKETEVLEQALPEQPVHTLVLPPEEELVPLFEAIAPPVSTATKEELEITQISFKIAPNEQGTEQLLVEGFLQNKTDALRSVPALTVVLFDKDNNILNRKKIHLDNERLEPKQALPFYTGITPVPLGVNHIDVQF